MLRPAITEGAAVEGDTVAALKAGGASPKVHVETKAAEVQQEVKVAHTLTRLDEGKRHGAVANVKSQPPSPARQDKRIPKQVQHL